VNQSRHSMNHEPTFAQLAADTVRVLWMRLRIWAAHQVADLAAVATALSWVSGSKALLTLARHVAGPADRR
jgi:hypothetical protein